MATNPKNLRVCQVEHESEVYDILVAVDTLDDVNDILQDWALENLEELLDLPTELVYCKDITEVITDLDIDSYAYLRSSVSSYMDVSRYAGISGDFPTLPTSLTDTYYVAPECYAFLYSEAGADGFFGKYFIEESNLSLSEGLNYLCIRYNAGSPEWIIYGTDASIDYSSIIPVALIIDYSNTLYVIPYGQYGYGLPEKTSQNDLATRILSTFTLETSSNYVALSALTAKRGIEEFSCLAVDTSAGDDFYQYSLDNTETWVKASKTTINNTQYQTDGSGLGTLGGGEFVINYMFRLLDETNKMVFSVLSNKFASLAAAKESEMPAIPDIIKECAVLVGRIIVEQGSTSPTVQKVQTVWFGTVS